LTLSSVPGAGKAILSHILFEYVCCLASSAICLWPEEATWLSVSAALVHITWIRCKLHIIAPPDAIAAAQKLKPSRVRTVLFTYRSISGSWY
jgi:hypothetical protein